MQEFATELTEFCSEIIEIVNIDEDQDAAIAKMADIVRSGGTSAIGEGMAFKKSVILIGTPGSFAELLKKKAYAAMKVSYHSVVLDKVDLLQAMDFKDEIVEIAGSVLNGQDGSLSGKAIMTTNIRDEKDLTIDE